MDPFWVGLLARLPLYCFGPIRVSSTVIFVFSHFFPPFQQVANILLLIAATLIGLLCYFLAEAKQRRAFLEAKQGLEVKMLIEEQSAEQVSSVS